MGFADKPKMLPFEAFLLLFGLAAVVSLIVFVGLSTDLSNAMTPIWLRLAWLLSIVAILFLSWRLARNRRPGLGCLLLLFGLPASFAGFVVMLFVVNPGPLH